MQDNERSLSGGDERDTLPSGQEAVKLAQRADALALGLGGDGGKYDDLADKTFDEAARQAAARLGIESDDPGSDPRVLAQLMADLEKSNS